MKRLESDVYGPIFFINYLHQHGIDYKNYRFNEIHKEELFKLYD